MEIEFLADMGISLRTVSWLREQGYDVVHLRDEGLQTLSDQEILAKAKRENRHKVVHFPYSCSSLRNLCRSK